jgi:hypothetical protein
MLLIGASFVASPASAQCRPGEVWGDVGCRPKASPSVLVRAARRIRKIRIRRSRPSPAAREIPSGR